MDSKVLTVIPPTGDKDSAHQVQVSSSQIDSRGTSFTSVVATGGAKSDETVHPPVAGLIDNAQSLKDKFQQVGERQFIDEAIVLTREALDLSIDTNPYRPICLSWLSIFLAFRHQQVRGVDDINECIQLDREALSLRPPGHPDRSASLNNIGSRLWARYSQLGQVEDLHEAVLLDREALSLCPPGHPDRSSSLNGLAVDLSTRYKLLGGVEDLHEAILLYREGLLLCPPGHPDRSLLLNNLANRLSTRYDVFGGVEDLNEAILLHEEALSLRPPGHPDRSTSLSNLAIDLWTRFKLLGGVEDLNDATLLDREALALRPPGHPDRSSSLNNLAIKVSTRYNLLGGVEDLKEAILLGRETLSLFPPGHPDRWTSLNNLSGDLATQYNRLREVRDLDEAILLSREALSLCPPGRPDRSMPLNNLAIHLSARYNLLKGVEDLNEAILLNREALFLRPSGHSLRSSSLFNLANDLWTLYNQGENIGELNEAITLLREHLTLHPLGHPDHADSVYSITRCLSTRFTKLGDPGDRDELFHFYMELARANVTASSHHLAAAKTWVDAAEQLNHETAVLAYRTSLRFLVQYLATLPSLPQHIGLVTSLSSSLAIDAFSAGLRGQSPTRAVEMLEQGRGMFWSQLTRLRSPLDDVINSGASGKMLGEEFKRLTSLIRNATDSPGEDLHDRVCHLNFELEKVASSIRELPGLAHFLLPSEFPYLQRAASHGPVIIVNASKHSCDAVVVFVDRDPVHIPLSVSRDDVLRLSSELAALTKLAKRSDVTRKFAIFLRELWNSVVSPIANFLRTVCPRGSRVWWCPTAEFSLLPLHAAAPHRSGQPSFSYYFISSYTPTLTALIRARQHSSSTSESTAEVKRPGFVAIGQANAKGTSKLVSVDTELTNIGQCVDGLATFTRIEGEESCISRVTEELGKNEWVHLACHGIPNRKKPFESAFALHDGRLTVQRIIGHELERSEFAYLSACHTTVGYEDSPDEVIHLASAMQFAGFRSVIGTMWAVDDEQTVKITPVFYNHMVDESGRLDYTRAAFALWKTMRSKELPDTPLDQRILYVHIGA